jgi:hypothetical protein
MVIAALPPELPSPDVIKAQIVALSDELRAMRRLLRASRAAAQAVEARRRRAALTAERGDRDGGPGRED